MHVGIKYGVKKRDLMFGNRVRTLVFTQMKRPSNCKKCYYLHERYVNALTETEMMMNGNKTIY